jgi:hypothetical protein
MPQSRQDPREAFPADAHEEYQDWEDKIDPPKGWDKIEADDELPPLTDDEQEKEWQRLDEVREYKLEEYSDKHDDWDPCDLDCDKYEDGYY